MAEDEGRDSACEHPQTCLGSAWSAASSATANRARIYPRLRGCGASRRQNDLAHSALCRYGDDESVSGACVQHLCELLRGDASRSSWVASGKRSQDSGTYSTHCSACLQSRARVHVEHVWEELREKHLTNLAFASLDEVIDKVCDGLNQLEADPERLRSMTYFPHFRSAS